MKLEDFKKGIGDIKNIRMTDSEKFSVKSNLDFYIETNTEIKYPTVSTWYSYFNLHTRAYSVAFACLLVFVSGMGAFTKAQNSLPGDTFYPLKVNVIEPLEYTATIDPVSKANLEVHNLDTRLREAEILQIQGKLSDAASQDIQNRINTHSETFNKIVSTLDDENNLSDDSDLKIDFEAKLNAHSKIIDSIDNSGDENSNIKKIRNVIAVNSNNEAQDSAEVNAVSVMMLSKSIVQESAYSTTTKFGSATSSRAFMKRKNDTENIIKTIKGNIEKSKKINSINKQMLKDAEDSILDAEKSLIDAENDNRSGDLENANINLKNSRKRAKEAGTTFEVSQDLSRQKED